MTAHRFESSPKEPTVCTECGHTFGAAIHHRDGVNR